ncbi:helix-turn-helix domain-containing protein [Alkaliphilus sp. MSJ-5]|uniref:Helix-turn-helix domain-containing protein n=1 Tax=Alkaliphilus flagellatus TaxID=2841507 RepID=A0ABS6G688_9FIRM|nr:helix-turn-helix transcriptional regulator [Alkaliphilus flagellatus]MBU5677883.1 helix-turn-helix domain-containing protein [Alkaliphilus flagellatus]
MNNIKALRIQSNLTQEDLALKLNISRSTVSMWETGESLPRSSKLQELAKILNCSIDELFKMK